MNRRWLCSMVRELSDGDRVLWYSKLPYGRESYAARIDPDGTLISLAPDSSGFPDQA